MQYWTVIQKPEITGKHSKKRKQQQSTETKRIVKIDIKPGSGRVFTLSLAGEGGSHPCHPSVMPLIRYISNMNSHNFFW